MAESRNLGGLGRSALATTPQIPRLTTSGAFPFGVTSRSLGMTVLRVDGNPKFEIRNQDAASSLTVPAAPAVTLPTIAATSKRRTIAIAITRVVDREP